VWFGLAPYAAAKVGESYGNFELARFWDPADAGVARKGFFEGNQAIFTSMTTGEAVYQAGGSTAVRAMQEAGAKFGGLVDDTNSDYRFSLSKSFELRDQAKAAFANGDMARGNELLGQSLRSSADFEQRMVIQQYYDKPQSVIVSRGQTVTKTLGQSLTGLLGILHTPWISDSNDLIDDFMRSKTTVTIDGKSVTFNGKDVSKVDERMPFVYDTAGAFMQAVTGGTRNGQTAQQRILDDQNRVIRNVWGDTSMPATRPARPARSI
jgi:hypothetical protein